MTVRRWLRDGAARYWLPVIVLGLAGLLLLAACGDGDDGEDRPGVSVIGESGGSVSGSVSGTGSVSAAGTGSASATGTGSASGPADEGGFAAMGGYTPVSDVVQHARVTLDIAAINALLGEEPYDFDAILALYENGENSASGDGNRTLAGFAGAERDEAIWNDYVEYFGDPTWLDTYVRSAITGTGAFDGEEPAVRRQGIQKGVQNQIMIAWMIHELVAAVEKTAAGEIDPASGAPHNWDEAWAFYHGENPDASPFATANSRGGNFGTGTAVNDAILAQMQAGLEAIEAGDAAGAQAAMDEILRQITITYVQASIRYATQMAGSADSGDLAAARVQQAEGWSFFRVIAPLVAAADADAASTVMNGFDLANEPSNSLEAMTAALESTYDGLGISPGEIGTLQ